MTQSAKGLLQARAGRGKGGGGGDHLCDSPGQAKHRMPWLSDQQTWKTHISCCSAFKEQVLHYDRASVEA